MPFRFDRPDELDEVQPFAGERTGRFPPCLHFRRARVQLRGIQPDGVEFIFIFHPAGIEIRQRQIIGLNELKAAVIHHQFAAAREEHGLGGQPDLNTVLRLPGALQSDNRSNTDEDQTALAESVQREIGPLLDQLKTMRAREGDALEAILHSTLDRLAEANDGVAALRPEIEERYQARLSERLLAATGPEFNRQRVLEEVAVLVERSDVAEEIARMTTHIGHFRELLKTGGEVGKKLDFLLQEMNREANTLLSKTGGVGGRGTRITELGLVMKSEIEKAREQIQNVE